MKKIMAFALTAVMALALAGCGAKPAPTEPPELTVANAQGASITAMGGSYDWDYEAGGGQRTGAIACGMHPLDETLRDSTPALEMPIALSASSYYTVTLDFGDCAPDSVILRCWSEQCWGDTEAKPEKLFAERQDNGAYTVELIPSIARHLMAERRRERSGCGADLADHRAGGRHSGAGGGRKAGLHSRWRHAAHPLYERCEQGRL